MRCVSSIAGALIRMAMVAGVLLSVVRCGWFAGPVYGQDDQQVSVPTSDQVQGYSLEQVYARITQLESAHLPSSTFGSVAAAWLGSHDLNSVLDRNQLIQNSHTWSRIYQAVNYAGVRGQDFSVVWTGFVKAPYDGAYTFSICPVDANCDEAGESLHYGMTVSVAGQQVLSATSGHWLSQGSAVSLNAGELTSLRVEFTGKYDIELIPWQFPAVARLLWQGPGVMKQLVPAGVLWSPDGTTPGLKTDYRVLVDGQQQTLTRTESVIDRMWMISIPLVSAYPEVTAQFSARVNALATDPDYLAQLEADPSQPHFLLRSNSTTSSSMELLEMLTCAQQMAFAEELVARPALLQPVAQEAMFTLYQLCRFGAADTALNLLGKWSLAHPEAESQFSVDPPSEDRYNYFGEEGLDHYALAYSMVWQYPAHLAILEQNYLTLSDGSCCLPVAYILAHGYAMQGQVRAWIENLDSRLNDNGLGGDRRVGWLLARAWAEQIRHVGKADRSADSPPVSYPLAGLAYLQEACLVAQSEPVRLRAYKEIATRLARQEQIDAARAQLDKAATKCSLPTSQATLAAWRQQLDALAARFTRIHQEQDAAAQQAYWNEIRARRQKAVAADDQAAVSQYEQLLSGAGLTP